MRAALCFLALAACSLETAVQQVPTEGAQAMLLARVDAGGAVRLDAFELEGSSAAYLAVPLEGGDLSLYALHYRCSLRALALDPGPLATGSGAGRPLPEPELVTAVELHGGGPQPLVRVAGLPPPLAQLRLLGAQSACAAFESQSFDLPDTVDAQVTVALPLGGDRVFLATREARSFEATPQGVVEHARLSTSTGVTGGFRAGDGELLLAGTQGRTLRGRPGGAFAPGPSTTSTQGFLRAELSGDPSGPLGELFLIDGVKSFERLSGGRFIRLDDGARPLSYDRGGVAWLSPGRAAAVGLNVGPLAYWSDGALSAAPLPVEPQEILRAIRYIPRWDLVVLTSEGRVLGRGDGGWSLLYQQYGGLRVIAPLDRGLFFGGGDGRFVQLHPGFEPCEDQLAGRNIGLLVELEHGFALVSDLERGQGSTVTFLRRTSPPLPASCPSED